MTNIIITIKKELRSIFRDKKTIMTLLVFPIMIPVMIFLYAYMYDDGLEKDKYVIGINYDTNSIEKTYLSEVNLEVKKYKSLSDMESAYKDGDIYGYIDRSQDGKKYMVYTNEDSEYGMYVSNYIKMYLENYNNYLGRLYVIGEGVDVDKAYNNFKYKIVNLEGENFMLSLMFTIAFTYIIMSIVMSTTNMATTATAVEKENGTMETLLTFPIRSHELVIGKYMAAVVLGCLSSLIGLVLTIGSLSIVVSKFSSFDSINYSISASSVMLSILVIILASLFIAGLSIAVTSNTKSYKEAQSASSALNMITIVPMFVSIMGLSVSRIYYIIPILNYTQVLMDINSGNIDIINIIFVVISSLIYVVGVIYYIINQYRTEKVLFGNVS